MNLTQKIGQLLVFGIPNDRLTADVLENLKKWHPGGIILFSRNIPDTTQLKQLTTELNNALSSDEFPLWFCVDQEGGVVVRLTQGVSVFPGNMALGATQNRDWAYEMGRVTAQEWLELGVNLNLAPVLDLSYPENPGIGVRSLGQYKESVSELGTALIQGMQESGMSATAKHFPGKGLARKDSHLDLPRIDISNEDLLETELYPFKKAIEADVDFVMSSHCIYTQFDSQSPATLSKPILTDLLRKELGFKGLVISDDLEMGAILKSMTVEEAALKFVQAGGDQVLVCHTPEVQEKVFHRLHEAVKNNELPESLLDEKVERIQAIKQKSISRQKKSEQNGLASGLKIAYEIAQNAITLVKNEDSLIPLDAEAPEKIFVLCVDYSPLTQVEEDSVRETSLEQLLKTYKPEIDFKQVALEPDPEQIKVVLNQANKADLLLIFTYNAHMYSDQAQLVQDCLNLGKKSVVSALRNPYDLSVFPQAKNYLVSYGFREASLKALVDVLFGRLPAKGILPTNILNQTVSS